MSKDKGWHYSGDRDYLSYGGYWWRKTGDREVTVIRIENLDEDSDKDLEKCRFEIDQLTIDLDDSDVADALRTVGWYDENPGKNWKKSSTDDRVNAMVAHWGSQLRSGGDDVVLVRGDEAAEKTLEQWKAGNEVEALPTKTGRRASRSSQGRVTESLPTPGARAIPFHPATNMVLAEPGGQVVDVPQGTVILYDRDKRAAKSLKWGKLEVQLIDAYRYQRELYISRKYDSGIIPGRWVVTAYMHPGLRNQAEVSEAVALKLIDRFWQLTTEYRDLLFNPDNWGGNKLPRGDGFVHFHTSLLLGATPSAKLIG